MVAAAKQLPQGATLYVDHANHLTPLTLCYHATASRHLTSGRSDVIPPSTTVEIDSAYCPRCLTFCDAASASSGVCKKDAGGCKDCPVCFSPVSLSIDENTADPDANGRLVCHYLCGHCQWSSRECGVTSNADKLLEYPSSDEMDASKENEAEKQRGIIIAEASKELELCLRQRINERNKEGDALFNSITKMWAQREQEEGRRKRMQVETISTKGGIDNGGKSWSVDKLEQSLLEKKKDLDSPYTDDKEGSDPAMEVMKSDDTTDIPMKVPTAQQMAAQMTLTTTTPQSRSDLLPLSVTYRTRVSRRCRAELAAGRTGILVKPKLNPLEGDTSLRAGHGQWWKKDSSAVHVVPRVQLCRHGADPTSHKYAVLLKVKNPTLNMIRLRLSGPSIPEKESDEVTESSLLIHPRELENILVDPFTETFVQGRLCTPEATTLLAPTDFFELDPADDPFLDIGKGREEDPSEVRDWDAMSTLGALGEGDTSQMRVVATQGDTAWVELVFCNVSSGGEVSSDDAKKYLAVPLALQIEVGNGSWEASLIKRRDLPEEERDLVTLNLVTLLH
eukprot:CAMPEP_0201945442 /NCGR_PEP_ID=MMETSP0903-20130614/53904_1 /ASSEMBLY_ACC=CAM_ASM_000552 /TAXON_ID=420261 /ORGANISM="Thalassiosira antarctica, Strain CCMP982" /LENGTH=562 /DNA_ID=CAMNT_0048488509 /DNA_START=13 /DNA_END=1701 /DNA_ORIENTATION=+